MALKIKDKINNFLILELEGKLDLYISLEIENKINNLIEKGERALILDLKKVSYISSSGIRIFISAYRKLQKLKGLIYLVNMQKNVEKIFKLLELNDLFSNYLSIEEVIEKFSLDQKKLLDS